jgi:hypothetical protein
MISKITLILIFLLISIRLFSQSGVVIEKSTITSEERRVQKIEDEIEQIQIGWKKDFHELFHNPKYSPANKHNGMTKAQLQEVIRKNESALYFIQVTDLQGKCERINQLKKNINRHSGDECSAINNRVNKLKSDNAWANEQLRKLGIKNSQENFAREKHQIDINKLDNEISELDKLLASDNEELKNYKKNNTRSLDDFLSEKGDDVLNKSSKRKSNNLDALLTSSNNKKTAKGNSLDDLLLTNDTGGKNNGLDKSLSVSSTKSSHKVISKNNLQGVVNGSGDILIPFKEWKIIEFKMGIAKVKKKIESRSFCSVTHTAYKEGFVDNSGEFIDGYKISFSEYRESRPNRVFLRARQTDPNESYEQRVARERAAEREKARREREEKIRIKQCRIEVNQWKRSIISKY